jgi:hypothetical protein
MTRRLSSILVRWSPSLLTLLPLLPLLDAALYARSNSTEIG